MKKTILILAAVLLSSLAFARPKYTMAWDDINTLQGMTQESLLARLGKPEKMCRLNDYQNVTLIRYSNLQLLLEETEDGLCYTSFVLTNGNFCVNSTMVKGGLRVGDYISKAAEYPAITKCEKPMSVIVDYQDMTRTMDFQWVNYDGNSGRSTFFAVDASGKITAIAFFDRM